jgi:hypothetical protein
VADQLYASVSDHMSGDSTVDLAAGKWVRLSSLNDAPSVAVAPAVNIAATNVQDAIEDLDTEKQTKDDPLSAIGALAMMTDCCIYATGADTVALGEITVTGWAILDAASAAQLATLGAPPKAGDNLADLV